MKTSTSSTISKHETPRLLAHRGAAEAATENGLLAFKYAIENGITGFETDFRLTADGEVVVMHDSDIKRTTTGSGLVEELTLAQIKSVKLKNTDEQVPTADELFSLFDNLEGFYLELEMKARYGEYYSPERMDTYLDKLYAAAKRHLTGCCVVFTCFDEAVLRRLKELHPDARIGLICGGLTQEIVSQAIALGCYSCAPTLKGTSQDLVDQLKQKGLMVNLWFSDTLELWNQIRNMGADVSTCNHPVDVLKAIREAAV